MSDKYKNKYLKYKNKYLILKGGGAKPLHINDIVTDFYGTIIQGFIINIEGDNITILNIDTGIPEIIDNSLFNPVDAPYNSDNYKTTFNPRIDKLIDRENFNNYNNKLDLYTLGKNFDQP